MGWGEEGGGGRGLVTGIDPTGDPGLSSGNRKLSVYLCCAASCAFICDNTSVKPGFGGGAWSDPGTFGDELAGLGGGEREPAPGFDPTGNRDPVNDPGLSSGNRKLSMYLFCAANCAFICNNISIKSGFGGGAWSDPGTFSDQLSGSGGRKKEPATGIDPTGDRDSVNDPRVSSGNRELSVYLCCSANCGVKSGLGGGAWSDPATFGNGNSPSANGSHRFCDAAVTFLVTFAPRRPSGLSRTATGAASARLMMESIKRVRVSILCCRICGTRDVD